MGIVAERETMDRSNLETIEQARDFYRAINDPTAKAILDFLTDHPGERFDGAAIVRHLSLGAHRDVAQATYLMGQIATAQGLNRPWAEGQLGYLMPEQEATLLSRARESLG